MHWKQVDSLSFLQSSVSHNCVRAFKERGVIQATALGKKLFLSLFVCVLIALYLFPDGRGSNSLWPGWFTFMYLSDAFIQSDLQCIQAIHLYCQYVCSLVIETHNLCATTTELYHWATETILDNVYLIIKVYLLIKAARIDVVQVRELGSHNSLCTLPRKIYPCKIFSVYSIQLVYHTVIQWQRMLSIMLL